MDPHAQQSQQTIPPQPVQQQVPQSIAGSSMKKILLSILGVIIVLGVIGGGYYLRTQKNSTVTSQQKTQVRTPTKVVIATPTFINSNTSTVTQNVNGIYDFTDVDLGVHFGFLPTQSSKSYHTDVQQNQIFIKSDDTAQTDQAVLVLPKDKSQSFDQAIRAVLGVQNPNCYVKTSGLVNPPDFPVNFEVAVLMYRGKDGKDASFEPGIGLSPSEAASNCLPDFMPIQEGRYFLYDPHFPNKFLFVTTGQFPIYSDIDQKHLWYQTLQIVNNKVFISALFGADRNLFENVLHDFNICISKRELYCDPSNP